jgi:hypothetical protein
MFARHLPVWHNQVILTRLTISWLTRSAKRAWVTWWLIIKIVLLPKFGTLGAGHKSRLLDPHVLIVANSAQHNQEHLPLTGHHYKDTDARRLWRSISVRYCSILWHQDTTGRSFWIASQKHSNLDFQAIAPMFRMPGDVPDEIQQSFPHYVTDLFKQRSRFKASPRLISIEKDIQEWHGHGGHGHGQGRHGRGRHRQGQHWHPKFNPNQWKQDIFALIYSMLRG